MFDPGSLSLGALLAWRVPRWDGPCRVEKALRNDAWILGACRYTSSRPRAGIYTNANAKAVSDAY